MHREVLRQRDADRRRVEQAEERRLLRVVGAGRVAEGGPDAAVALGDQVLAAQLLVRAVAPVAPRTLVEALGEGLGQPIAERLHQDGVVVVVLAPEALGAPRPRRCRPSRRTRRRSRAGRSRAAPRSPPASGRACRDRAAAAGAAVEARQLLAARVVAVEHDVVAVSSRPARSRRRRWRGRRRSSIDALQHVLPVGEELPRRAAHLRVLEDLRVLALQLPGREEEGPVDERDQLGDREVLEHAATDEGRLRARPRARHSMGTRLASASA